jgi:site-specific DNA-cytosine methylase
VLEMALPGGTVSLTVGSLFSGIGGFDLAFQREGFEVAWMCEIEPFPRKVLAQRFPGVPVVQWIARRLRAVMEAA